MSTPLPSTALTKRSLDTSLMPPPPRPKRIKRPAKVLDEDDYTDALSHIIARDFFPGLLEIEAKQDYLEALDSRDHEWVVAAGRKLTEVMTPGPSGRQLRGRRGTSMTPGPDLVGRGGETPKAWQGDTPMSVVSFTTSTATPKAPSKPEIDTNINLSAFQEKYTSEDNESFYALLDKQNHKKAEKYAWMWSGNKIPAARQIAHRKRQNLLSAAKVAEEAENNGKALAVISSDTRQAMPDTWTSRPDNNFMFGPPSIEDDLQTVAQKNQETSLAPPKKVAYDNTRIVPPLRTSGIDSIPPSPSLSAVRDAIAGNPRPTPSETLFTSAKTPRVNGYAFVDEEEPPPPSTHHQLLISGTCGDATPNPFKLKESSKREALHHRMVDKVAKGKRAPTPLGRREVAKTPKFMSSPVVKKGTGALTPAGAMLMGKMSGRVTPGGLWEGKGKMAATPRRSGLRGMVTPKG